MITLFENNDFILKSTGHDYDFVGIIETKGDEPLTFFFSEEYVPHNIEDEDNVDESKTELLEVHQGLKRFEDSDDDDDEEFAVAESLCADSFFRTRDDKSTGFMSEPRERGQFLAIIKAYCPEQLEKISWA